MAMTAKVEIYCDQHNFHTKSISVDGSDRSCVNCIWYEQYYHQNRGNIRSWVPTRYGYCLLHERQRGALQNPCKEFERKEDTK